MKNVSAPRADPQLDRMLLETSIQFYEGVLLQLKGLPFDYREIQAQLEANKLMAERELLLLIKRSALLT